MIAYADGDEARRGDRVDLDGVVGVVEAVIDTEAERRAWGLNERGIMVDTESYGLMFETLGSASWPAVLLLRRSEA